MDPADHDRLRDDASADRRTVSYLHMHVLVALHGQPGLMDRNPDAPLGGRDDRRSINLSLDPANQANVHIRRLPYRGGTPTWAGGPQLTSQQRRLAVKADVTKRVHPHGCGTRSPSNWRTRVRRHSDQQDPGASERRRDRPLPGSPDQPAGGRRVGGHRPSAGVTLAVCNLPNVKCLLNMK